ncbi:VCBS repeat-containing protein [Pseudozobellia thermophila]|uniref:Repeat domain-containing protein n=1 Tax=Pseudozobellia thermophila TaxID=192903 RepID=A0A1M6CXP7_9FLAO|nr:VCBS repeat-containing protein [Pseudozobellia thermophila]SHI65767.1 Repeat domain-containing protein [Pseudozobellia thermophila]
MRWFFGIFLVSLLSCSRQTPKKEQNLFTLKEPAQTGVFFENALTYSETFNPYLYRNFYNGGGVAVGDVNNDGLEDIYFTGNMVDNKLFLNKGGWKFEEIANKAGVACPGVWSTGATFVDINGDGLLDLYVCKSGKPEGENRHNELFINNGDLTFTEASKEYGLDINGLSVHAAFFDYDKDGDLDVYILNNSLKSIGGFDLVKDQRKIPDEQGNGNKFFRNDNGKFTDITEKAGIYSSKIGFGLGITLGDFDQDGWTDIFVSNDFFERDYLYINDQKGGFTEALENYFSSISMGSMGADMADLNNDLLPDLIVTEMLPETDERQKTKTVFESWDKHALAVKKGYYYQYPRNVLQRNLGRKMFAEVGRQAKVAATEWSWAALIFDMDNDGLRDIFISNGIYKDLLDRDYLNFEADQKTVSSRIHNQEKNVITKLIDAMPSQPVANSAFHNLGSFNFENKNTAWGLGTPSFSNGSAYADLDNDGDLDLILNNVNMPSFIYENNTDTLTHRSFQLSLSQPDGNSKSIGAKAVITYGNGQKSYADNFVSRGFQSSVTSTLHFGVGNTRTIDTLHIEWPDGTVQLLTDLPTNRPHHIEHPGSAHPTPKLTNPVTNLPSLQKIEPLFQFAHKENRYIDFNNERLLPQMFSNEGPAFASEDMNNDGVPDYFLGGAKGQPGQLFVSGPNGYRVVQAPFEPDQGSEDTCAVFFDGDNDGDLDLYVGHGGRAYSPYSTDLHDSYYQNEGGTFEKSNQALPFSKSISTSTVIPQDFDHDGDIDLFIGERYHTSTYGLPGSGYLLKNQGQGKFDIAQTFTDIGMITDAAWIDLNSDGWEDLIVVGEWMAIKAFINYGEEGFKEESETYGLTGTQGLWTALGLVDVDNDGDQDVIAGNIGLNNFYEADMRMFISDFDGNGFKEQILCKKKGDAYYPIVDKDELISQIPSLKKKLLYYKDYAQAHMGSLFNKEILDQAVKRDLKILKSLILLNNGGTFTIQDLPDEIQYAPIYAITAEDLNNDGIADLFLGGNQFYVKPQFGKYDGSMGWGILGPVSRNSGETEVFPLRIKGQIRSLKWSKLNNEPILVATINNDSTEFYRFIED